MESANALSAKSLGLIYHTGSGAVEALRNVSLEIRRGEFICVVGPSGCGKSSLLKIILGLESATSGSISIAGQKINGPSRMTGCVFQAPVLLPWRTVLDNVLLPADIMKLNRTNAVERAKALLEMVGLGSFDKRYPFELSGGMQQRAAIVRALVHDPEILMMDEPFAALDAMTRERMSVELQRIARESGKTIVFITHSISEAAFLSDRIVVMSPRPGRIVEVINNPMPKPRQFDDLNRPEMADLQSHIRRLLDEVYSA